MILTYGAYDNVVIYVDKAYSPFSSDAFAFTGSDSGSTPLPIAMLPIFASVEACIRSPIQSPVR